MGDIDDKLQGIVTAVRRLKYEIDKHSSEMVPLWLAACLHEAIGALHDYEVA